MIVVGYVRVKWKDEWIVCKLRCQREIKHTAVYVRYSALSHEFCYVIAREARNILSDIMWLIEIFLII